MSSAQAAMSSVSVRPRSLTSARCTKPSWLSSLVR
ncbi:hypothetical protein GECvBGOT_gp207 [Salmonella phage GEC_vB_GOT]|nr:hypothetical protein GECvBGOT_gp207 [Salmonella phage GEC_vB_GOT]